MLFMVVAVCCGKQMNATSGFEKCESSICEPTKHLVRAADEHLKVPELTRFGLMNRIATSKVRFVHDWDFVALSKSFDSLLLL